MKQALSDRLPNRRVLIVEDEPRLREMLSRAIPDMGFQPESANTGEKAIRVMQEEPCTVAILDLNLPGMSGMELFEQFKQKWPKTQVIIMTGYGDLESAKKAIHLDVVDFLTKPCTLGDLEVAIDRAWHRAQGISLDGVGVQPPAGEENTDAEAFRKPEDDSDKPRTLQQIERESILAALDRHGGNRAEAAAELGISVRTLYYRLAQYQNNPGDDEDDDI